MEIWFILYNGIAQDCTRVTCENMSWIYLCLSLGSGMILLKMVADKSTGFIKIKQFIDHLMTCLSRLPPGGKPNAVNKYITS